MRESGEPESDRACVHSGERIGVESEMHAVVPAVESLWGAAGIIVGFQVTAFTLRINREIDVSRSGDFTWFPVADLLNMLSLSVTLIGVFALPALDVIGRESASRLFGLSVLLLLGYAFALAGHYEMYRAGARTMRYFPTQERVVVALVAAAALIYIVAALAM